VLDDMGFALEGGTAACSTDGEEDGAGRAPVGFAHDASKTPRDARRGGRTRGFYAPHRGRGNTLQKYAI